MSPNCHAMPSSSQRPLPHSNQCYNLTQTFTAKKKKKKGVKKMIKKRTLTVSSLSLCHRLSLKKKLDLYRK